MHNLYSVGVILLTGGWRIFKWVTERFPELNKIPEGMESMESPPQSQGEWVKKLYYLAYIIWSESRPSHLVSISFSTPCRNKSQVMLPVSEISLAFQELLSRNSPLAWYSDSGCALCLELLFVTDTENSSVNHLFQGVFSSFYYQHMFYPVLMCSVWVMLKVKMLRSIHFINFWGWGGFGSAEDFWDIFCPSVLLLHCNNEHLLISPSPGFWSF